MLLAFLLTHSGVVVRGAWLQKYVWLMLWGALLPCANATSQAQRISLAGLPRP
jgi:hypothetical protein